MANWRQTRSVTCGGKYAGYLEWWISSDNEICSPILIHLAGYGLIGESDSFDDAEDQLVTAYKEFKKGTENG